MFRRSAFLTGEERQGSGAPDVWWFRPDGRKMTQADWARGDAFALGAFLGGQIPTQTPTASRSRTTRSSCSSTPGASP